jgi:acyl-CoA hydrolase
MSTVIDLYRSKRISAERAAAMVTSDSVVDYYAFTASSRYLDAALAQRVGELANVTIRSELRVAPPPMTFLADPTGRTFHFDSLFRGPFESGIPAERSAFTPARLSGFEQLFYDGDMHSDFAAFMVSPPDNDGFLYFCPSPSLAKGDVRTAKCFFAEINENLFPIPGSEDRRIHLSEVHYVVEGENPPILEVPNPRPSEVDRQIAGHIMKALSDGVCLQVGYGEVPDAVATLIGQSDLKDLGVHTEFLGDGLMHLYHAGKITGARKTTDRGKMVSGIAFGTRALYEFIRTCPDLHLTSSAYSNNPDVIRQNENCVSINAFLEIDLSGQVNSESIGTHTLSGTGGQLDFVIGAQQAKNGKAILCSPSSYVKRNGSRVSRIVAALAPGTAVTTPRSSVQYVTTEYGMVNLRGRNLWERAELLIGIAHPDFRQDLIKQAQAIGVCRPRNRV